MFKALPSPDSWALAAAADKQFHYNETYLSSGFYSIWLPPKIG
ncbi:hypothetical protein [Taibaiella sp. KBW10]|nr:hypothetical protein [Taibaiella sp. KBW10]